jgi:hypothetical protein
VPYALKKEENERTRVRVCKCACARHEARVFMPFTLGGLAAQSRPMASNAYAALLRLSTAVYAACCLTLPFAAPLDLCDTHLSVMRSSELQCAPSVHARERQP